MTVRAISDPSEHLVTRTLFTRSQNSIWRLSQEWKFYYSIRYFPSIIQLNIVCIYVVHSYKWIAILEQMEYISILSDLYLYVSD